jgi:hypothetical protein
MFTVRQHFTRWNKPWIPHKDKFRWTQKPSLFWRWCWKRDVWNIHRMYEFWLIRAAQQFISFNYVPRKGKRQKYWSQTIIIPYKFCSRNTFRYEKYLANYTRDEHGNEWTCSCSIRSWRLIWSKTRVGENRIYSNTSLSYVQIRHTQAEKRDGVYLLTSVKLYQTTRRHISEDSNIQSPPWKPQSSYACSVQKTGCRLAPGHSNIAFSITFFTTHLSQPSLIQQTIPPYAIQKYPERLHILVVTCHRMAKINNYRPLTAEPRVQSQVSPCGICGVQSGTGTDSIGRPWALLILPLIHTHISFIYHEHMYTIKTLLSPSLPRFSLSRSLSLGNKLSMLAHAVTIMAYVRNVLGSTENRQSWLQISVMILSSYTKVSDSTLKIRPRPLLSASQFTSHYHPVIQQQHTVIQEIMPHLHDLTPKVTPSQKKII